jgi:hypothetical protein
MPPRPPSWSRQELILALELYFDVGAADYRSSRKVQELSRLIRAMHGDQPYLADPRFRSASSVSRKLKNIAWIDPLNTRGTAQSHGSAVDEEIWDEFAEDRERLAREAAGIRQWIEAGLEGPVPQTTAPAEVEAVLDAIDLAAGKRRRSGQGFRSLAAERRAIERYAMDRATEHFAESGWSTITDVSKDRCFDLLCQRGASELRVEVKGTTTEGNRILLTRNEVTHARRVFPRVALYVLARIELSVPDDEACVAKGGIEIVRDPWDIRAGQLQALAYEYGVPPVP